MAVTEQQNPLAPYAPVAVPVAGKCCGDTGDEDEIVTINAPQFVVNSSSVTIGGPAGGVTKFNTGILMGNTLNMDNNLLTSVAGVYGGNQDIVISSSSPHRLLIDSTLEIYGTVFISIPGASMGIYIAPGQNQIIITGLPTSSTGLPSGAVWNNGGVLNIVQ